MTLQDNMNTLMQGLKPRVSAGMIRGKRIQYNASTTLTVATHKALAPSGYELAGWEVIAIGGGAAGRFNPGLGGWREPDFVGIDLLAGAATVAITVGLGGIGSGSQSQAAGGTSSFGPYVVAVGGELTPNYSPDLSHPFWVQSSSGGFPPSNLVAIQEGAGAGFSTPSGKRGAAGGINSATSSERRGGASYPVESSMTGQSNGWPAFISASFSTMNLSGFVSGFKGGAGNPNQNTGAAGHNGIGDWCGGGGNGGDSTAGGNGGFPGGGGGCGSDSTNHGAGGNGTVIVYPWFRKVLPA
ncbi:glycine-rich domain-containing protein [uncultured Brevundimonas sp.]|uniref:glycine-rich domain-containing protein n=1 Tax=uncultured Brevundimonas sp. TaxID=213418 RepID=UPI0025E1FE31|nr:hypothetical protein [uncultured Brevundimonas sp.]